MIAVANKLKQSNELIKARSRHSILLWIAFLFSIFVNLLMLTGPLFMIQVYDRVLVSKSKETLVALLTLVVGLYSIMWVLDTTRNRILSRFGARFQTELDKRVFTLAFFVQDGNPKALTANRDLEAVQSFLSSPALTALLDAPFAPIFIVAIYFFHPVLGWLALAGAATLIVLTFTNQLLTRTQLKDGVLRSESAHRFAEDTRRASDLIRSQGMLEPVCERWLRQRDKALEANMKASDRSALIASLTKTFRLTLQSLVLALGAWLVLQGELTAGAMIAASILLGRGLAPIEQLLGRWQQVERARDGWVSLRLLLDCSVTKSVEIRLPQPSGEVAAKAITVTSGPGKPAILYNVSFKIASGEALGVIGRSGSGKTTLAKVLLALIEPNVGEVRLGGALMGHYDRANLGKFVGYLPQEPILISGTIAENIARMASNPNSEAVISAAIKARAHELIISLPDGYETRVSDNSAGLSGGQRQRIALARALFGDPALLVLDEPNSALDMEGTEALNQAIRKTKSDGRSVIVMTHRPMAISECDKLMILEAGRVNAIGPRDEVLKSMMKNATEIQRTLIGGVTA